MIEQRLIELFGTRFKQDEPLARHLNFRIGGPAKYFVEVRTVEEVQEALRLAKEAGLETFILGGGSNTLASDDGFDGVVIKLALRNTAIEGTTVVADAGVISAALARQTAKAGLKGFEWAISLPGTVGGAARGNAGCFGGEIKDVATSLTILRDGEVIEIPASEMHYGYRESIVKKNNDIILRVTMELEPGDSEALLKSLDDKLAARKATQPLHAGSAGCVFKNYEIDSEEELERLSRFDIPEEMLKAGRISAGWVVDSLDLKGKQIGGAKISDEHGNFVINSGDATASDVVQLIALVKTKARNEYGIQLHEEVQYLGF